MLWLIIAVIFLLLMVVRLDFRVLTHRKWVAENSAKIEAVEQGIMARFHHLEQIFDIRYINGSLGYSAPTLSDISTHSKDIENLYRHSNDLKRRIDIYKEDLEKQQTRHVHLVNALGYEYKGAETKEIPPRYEKIQSPSNKSKGGK